MKFTLPLILFFTSFQAADALRGESKPEVPDHRANKVKGPKKRECKIRQGPNTVKSGCKSKTSRIGPDIKDEINYEVQTSPRGVNVKVEYFDTIQDNTTDTTSQTQFDTYFDSIIEYTKASESADPAYDWESDTVIQTLVLDTWQDISPVWTDEETLDSSFSVSNPEGNVTFYFTIRPASNDETVTANSMKIDFRLDNFPWQREDSYVALLATVETRRRIDVGHDNGVLKEAAANTTVMPLKAKDVLVSFDDVIDTQQTITPFGEFVWAEDAEAASQSAMLDNETESTNGTESAVSVVRVVATSPLVEPEDRLLSRALAEGDAVDGVDPAPEGDAVDEVNPEVEGDVVDGVDPEVEGNAVDGGEDPEADADLIDGVDPAPEGDLVDGVDPEAEKKKEDNQSTRVQSIAFSFVGDAAHAAERIFWDPEVGVGYSADGSGVGQLPVLFGLFSALFVSVAAF